MIIALNPFRVSFFDGADFPEHFLEHGVTAISTAIDKYCYLSVHSLDPFFHHRIRLSYAQAETVGHASEIRLPLVRECLGLLAIDAGMEINHVADLPGRTGLGLSSSFTVGLLYALHAFRGESVDAAQLARESIVVERERIGDAGGHQDQYAATFGGLRRHDFTADGGRGFLLLYVEPAAQPAVRAALRSFIEIPFTFSNVGSQIIFRTA